MNLFSGLNNLEDITIDHRYATITGYTQDDLENHFTGYLKDIDMEAVKRWYNGYNYLGETVYNPYDILLFFSKGGIFENYWWETGGTSFLIEKLKEGSYYLPNLENIIVSKETLSAFDVEHIDLVALLWQTGYLTFHKRIRQLDAVVYQMKVPNLEVQKSLNALFFDYLTRLGSQITANRMNTVNALLDRNFDGFKDEIYGLFASIPYENYVKNTIGCYEGYYASVMYAYLCSLGFEAIAEDATNLGRVDLTLTGPGEIFIFEFKVDKPGEAALHQIEANRYFEKYLNKGKAVFLIGVHFDSKKRNIAGMAWKAV